MDKNAIKKYAVWARRELISRVSKKAEQFGITEENIVDANADTVNGHLLTSAEKNQRRALISRIEKLGYKQTMEEAAYTWFNRFTALRFMEVNGYLPSHVRVFTDEQNAFKPQILTEAIHLEMDGLDMEKVYALKEENKTEELYKYLLITQCNALREALPGMFTGIEDYTELLFPDNLLREGSAIEQMITLIPEDDWRDAVQIIGWLYQYYNIEDFNAIYDGVLSSSQINKDLIPAATQLFTPDWVVRYMVENSLGRLWVEGHPNDEIKENWKYYLEEPEQEPEVKTQLTEIRKEYATLKPEEIKVIDPCMGSGHILVYMFDVLVQIYESYGYNAREAAGLILKNNLYGLDIDDRASQLAYFAVMMKARQYDRRIFTRGIQPHVYAIVESNGISSDILTYFENGDDDLKEATETIVCELHDAKEYGSILNVAQVDFAALYARLDEVKEDISLFATAAQAELRPMIEVAEAMAQKYHIVVTNPPYLGSGKFDAKLSEYIGQYYLDEKSDLGMVMLKRILFSLLKKNGFAGAITTVSWMFIKSFEKFRENIIRNKDFVCLTDFGTELFEGKTGHLPVVSWVSRNNSVGTEMTAIRLVKFCYSRRDEKEAEYFNMKNRYYISQKDLMGIPGMPVAYWISKAVLNSLASRNIGEISEARMGLTTGRNDKYLRLWQEVDYQNIGFGMDRQEAQSSTKRWFPYDKGGDYRKWYGNRAYVVDWYDDGHEMQTTLHPDGKRIWAHNFNLEYNFREHISWNDVVMNALSFRYFEKGFLFDSAAATTFVPEKEKYAILAYLNSSFVNELAKLLNPTIHFKLGDYAKLPYGDWDNVYLSQIAQENIKLSKEDWDSFEVSWDFRHHPLVDGYTSIRAAYINWEKKCLDRYNQSKRNEEAIDKYFAKYYQTEYITNENRVASVQLADKKSEVISLISYAVGCMFGRYSLDCDGIAYAGGEWDDSKYTIFPADKDNIIPICDDEYFDDDITARFIKWVETVYGKETLEENLKFIADALGGKGSPREVIRNYFINGFYTDHLKTYQKRPIYWLFESGKKNGFKALIYMHRYKPDTVARMRTDYVHEQQSRYRTAIEDLENRLSGASTSERVKLTKQLQKLQDQAEELRVYEEKIHHLADMMIPIDLDDGVKVNYAKFADVLARIK